MNAHAASRLAARLLSAGGRDGIGAALADEVVRSCGADACVVLLPAGPGGAKGPHELFLAGPMLADPADAALAAAIRGERVQQWLMAQGAQVCRKLGVPGPAGGLIVAAWRDSARVPSAVGAVLELAAAQVSLLVERDELARRVESTETALHDAEGQIARTRRVRAIGQMASGVAHDFNNCLTSILGFCELALGSLEDRHPGHADFSNIRTVALDAASLVRRLQTFGRQHDVADREIIDLCEVARAMPEIARPRWARLTQCDGVPFEIVVDAQAVPPVQGVPAEIRELLLNLLFNAVDAMPSGGKITLATREVERWAEISVTDEGHGMTPEVKAQLFKPFFTTKAEEGSGLGLSVCRTIAERHGGSLTVRSAPGEGATLTLRLPPAAVGLLPPSEAPQPRSSSPGAGRRILLVDDQREVRASVGDMLRVMGHTVTLADDAAAALTVIGRQRIDVVITDFGMPGLNGTELAERLRVLAPDVPVVLLTGWAVDTESPVPANIARQLSKPVTMKALGEALAACETVDVPSKWRATCC